MAYNQLLAEEERVIVHKGTERPCTGKYEALFAPGTYAGRHRAFPVYFATTCS
jgi:peptide methionine sulfoxide reductase MsrB